MSLRSKKKLKKARSMVVVTGGAGFIGSALVWKLNAEGITNILIVDELGSSQKWRNLTGRHFEDYLHKDNFIQMIRDGKSQFNLSAIVHMGACTDTTEQDAEYLMENNYRYSRDLAEWALRNKTRFIYASSAATYGDGTLGFSDENHRTEQFLPLNMYGYSKQLFDLWVLRTKAESQIAGIKFFNVFGPNEYHKGNMSSVVYKAFQQIKDTGRAKLFKSYKPEFQDGMQMRDFVYVKDCVEILWWMIQNQAVAGIFNLGTGKARPWNDLVRAAFSAMDLKPQIDFIDMPGEIRNNYQYFTEAKMDKLRSAGYSTPFRSLEDAVRDYIVNYLRHPNPYL